MSNYLAIATVTAALGRIVQQAAEASGVGSVGLDFGRPTATGTGQTERKVHIYLYQVTPMPRCETVTSRPAAQMANWSIGLKRHWTSVI